MSAVDQGLHYCKKKKKVWMLVNYPVFILSAVGYQA